jgi:CSLREA domain-containing protein
VLVGDAGGIRRAVALFFALAALACMLALPAVAGAENFEVDSVADETDSVVGNELCVTAAGKCTLRAALEEANFEANEDGIGFVEEVEGAGKKMEGLFDGGPAATIAPASGLPPIAHALRIEGECVVALVLRPCVGIAAPDPSKPALVVENSEDVEIDGLAITGASTAIAVTGTPRFKAFNNWFGVKLDGSAGANATGILLGPGSNRARIGNSSFRNVFANNSDVGLDILGAANASVMSGYFGVAPDGVTMAANGKDIEVTADSGSALEAPGTTIGNQLSPEALATPECDGGCNVISGSGSSGIDLEGEPAQEEAPAASTTVIGNYIGLAAGGTVAVANAGDGIHVGQAARTVIGGPRTSEANRFGAGDTAVAAGPAAANLVVRGNSIGVGANGASVAPPTDGVLVNSEGLPSAAAEATIADNEIRLQGGVGIGQNGLGGWIAGNWIAGATTGIATSGYEERGNLIEGNLIEGSTLNAILIENELNEVLANEVLGSGGAGIKLLGVSPFRTYGNRVGGDTEAEENAIFGSGGAAIEIANIEKNSNNEVARNWGGGNGGPFIDLVALSPKTEPKGPNDGVAPPLFEAVGRSEASGSAAPKARVRIFRKAGAAAGELESFLGEAVADEEGFWVVDYATLPPGATIAATQTVGGGGGGGTSELRIAATPPAPPVPDACPATGCTAPADETPPQSKIRKHPPKKSDKTTAKFAFVADEAGASFQCKLDKKKFKACKSPKKYKHLKPGKHVFQVRARDSSGNVEPQPAKYKFTVLG